MKINFRRAQHSDLKFLFDLRNEPEVRRFSLTTEPISLDTHTRWFEKRIASSDSVIFIAEAEQPIAQIRFDIIYHGEMATAEVSIAVVSAFRGKGYGTLIIEQGSRLFLELHPHVAVLHAYVNTDNPASLRSFSKAAYELQGESNEGGKGRYFLILKRPTHSTVGPTHFLSFP